MPLVTATATVTLRGTSDLNIAALANLLPDFSTGDKVHNHFVNQVAGLLPGNYSQMFGTGPSFRSIFYPNYTSQSPEQNLTADTGLNNAWWNGFSVAVLCQIIANNTSSIRGQMLSPKINTAVTNYNNDLNQRAARFYSRVLRDFQPVAAILPKLNMSTAKAQYRQALVDNILVRQLWFASGLWNSPDWEMFNHYAKYMILGASDAEVDALIDALEAGGLPIPSIVSKANWRTYSHYLMNHPVVNQTSLLSAASTAVHASTYGPTFGGGMPVAMPEGNCYEFTANSQPGSGYRRLPSSSCFASSTQILMATGEIKAITEVKSGDKVESPDGPRTVLWVSTPDLGGRPLYQVNGKGPCFSDTHPFTNASVNSPNKPEVLSVNPARLRALIPTLNQHGIGTLNSGASLRSKTVNGAVQEFEILTVSEVPSPSDVLYDLILSFNEPGTKAYWAGRDGLFFLTRPEMAMVDDAPNLAIAMAVILKGLVTEGIPGIQDDSDANELVAFQAWLHQYGAAVFHNALLTGLANVGDLAADSALPNASTATEIDGFLKEMDRGSKPLATGIAILTEALVESLGTTMTSSIDMGWRVLSGLGGDIIAVAMFNLELTSDTQLRQFDNIDLVMTIDGGSADLVKHAVRQCEYGCTAFQFSYNRQVHYQGAGSTSSPSIHFGLRAAGQTTFFAQGALPAIEDDVDYQRRSVAIYHSGGGLAGHLSVEVRRMSEATLAEEASNFGAWTADNSPAFALSLGAAMVDPIIKGLSARLTV